MATSYTSLRAEDSAVFDLVPDNVVTLDLLLGLLRATLSLPHRDASIMQQPSLVAKFAKAQRYETDRLHLYPFTQCERQAGTNFRPSYGVAAVVVGEHFVGTIAGLAGDISPGLDVMASFLAVTVE